MTQPSYQHSETVAKLKGIKETISGNPTTYQLLSPLDDLLYKAILPLVEGTKFIDTYVAQILGWQTTNPKRKATGVGRQAFVSNATLFLLLDSPKQKVKLLRSTKIDRGILFEALRRWLHSAQALDVIASGPVSPENFERLYNLAKTCNVREGHNLYYVYQQVAYWYGKASEFKTFILEKYTRLCISTATRDYKEMNHAVDLDDIVQTYLLTADKAINKCDADRGVLTSHINNWLMSAKNTVMSDNVQSNISKAKAVKGKSLVGTLTESVPLEDIADMAAEESSVEDQQDTVRQVRLVAKQFDPSGIGRILLHIEDVLSDDDYDALMAHALRPLQ